MSIWEYVLSEEKLNKLIAWHKDREGGEITYERNKRNK